jgi:hypothetical protein
MQRNTFCSAVAAGERNGHFCDRLRVKASVSSALRAASAHRVATRCAVRLPDCTGMQRVGLRCSAARCARYPIGSRFLGSPPALHRDNSTYQYAVCKLAGASPCGAVRYSKLPPRHIMLQQSVASDDAPAQRRWRWRRRAVLQCFSAYGPASALDVKPNGQPDAVGVWGVPCPVVSLPVN